MGVAKRQSRGIVRAGYGANRAGYGLKKNSNCTSSFNELWNSKNIIKMNPNFIVFFQEIILLKQFKKVVM